jgi:hypothetical protein
MVELARPVLRSRRRIPVMNGLVMATASGLGGGAALRHRRQKLSGFVHPTVAFSRADLKFRHSRCTR